MVNNTKVDRKEKVKIGELLREEYVSRVEERGLVVKEWECKVGGDGGEGGGRDDENGLGRREHGSELPFFVEKFVMEHWKIGDS